MIVALDVHYRNSQARAVAVGFTDWASERLAESYGVTLPAVAPYAPGAFYKRELPCLLAVLQGVDLAAVTCLVVDGYVVLGAAGQPGLGQRLYEALGERVPVVGVAKTRFFDDPARVRPVRRGSSANPLYVTAVGCDLDAAAAGVACMAGPHRLPTLLRQLDALTRQWPAA